MRESKSLALPLGYTPIILNERRSTGIEPASVSATSWCVNHFTTTAIFQTRAAGIEPTPKVLETFVLPLNYARKGNMEGEGFEPPNPKERIYSPPRLASSLSLQNIKLMARDGIEPPTHGASIHCSTNWATEPKYLLTIKIPYEYPKRSRRELNPRSSPWQGDVITATLRDLFKYFLT